MSNVEDEFTLTSFPSANPTVDEILYWLDIGIARNLHIKVFPLPGRTQLAYIFNIEVLECTGEETFRWSNRTSEPVCCNSEEEPFELIREQGFGDLLIHDDHRS